MGLVSSGPKAPKTRALVPQDSHAEDEEEMDLNVTHEDLYMQQAFRRPADLKEVLRRPHMRAQFREFLRRSLAQENLLFFETIELYQRIDKAKWRQSAGLQMIEKFLEPDSLFQVNLPARVAEHLRSVTTFEADSFDEAKREIFRLMNDNFFNRFVHALDESERQARAENERRRQEDERRKQGSFAHRMRRASSNAFALIRRVSSARESEGSPPA
ncbi:Regulator of G-protein signaling 4 [Hondaea fermentalgiana]|uniref:Regulator of G-protein signaling 4 n=1 Tax=Hondaea fermentalgiana TaxID=2315210 RepID=A0A2R5GDW2_9STRA|nr:Regulator of G-protein signaling 4 [Hondaea fermentalgiana]|eukprot:GBG29122.1 Regulator of G-protein signaling 4 [Hondaea fermentalgiana]